MSLILLLVLVIIIAMAYEQFGPGNPDALDRRGQPVSRRRRKVIK